MLKDSQTLKKVEEEDKILNEYKLTDLQILFLDTELHLLI